MFAVELLHHREFILLSLVCAKRTSYKLAVWLHSDNDCAINNRDYDLFRLPAFQALSLSRAGNRRKIFQETERKPERVDLI